MNVVDDRFDAARVALDAKNRVEASAGTGKTHAITTLFVRLIVEKDLDPSQIAVVTFTEAATAELRQRIRERLVSAERAFRAAHAGGVVKDATLAAVVERRGGHLESDVGRLAAAVEDVDEAAISTIHGFCQQMLHDNAFGTRTIFDAELVANLDDLRDDVVYDYWHRNVGAASPAYVEFLRDQGIDVGRLRQLVRLAQRNPRARVEPATRSISDADLAEALAEVRRHALPATLEEYLTKHVKKSALPGPSGRVLTAPQRLALSDAVERIKRGDQDALPANAGAVFPEALRELWGGGKGQKGVGPYVPHPFFDGWERFVRLSWGRAIDFQAALLRSLPSELSARKERRGVIGFEDLLLRLAQAVAPPGGESLVAAMRERFRAVLIDEFQDTDPVQLEVFDTAYGDGNTPLFLIGDPKQAIYAFRGGDVFTYLRGGRDAKKQYTMSVNWRSDAGLVNAVNRLFSQPDAFRNDGIRYRDVEPHPGASRGFSAPPDLGGSAALDVWVVRRPDDSKPIGKVAGRTAVARLVAADIVRLLSAEDACISTHEGGRRVAEGDIAVLTRTNQQCRLVQDALSRHGVHSVLVGDQTVFESSEATDVQHLLGAVLDPSSNFDVKRALSTRLLGNSASDLAALEDDPIAWNEWASMFSRWQSLWVGQGLMQMFRAVLEDTGCVEGLLAQRGGERALTNLLHLAELLHRAAAEEHMGPSALAQWLRNQRKEHGMAKVEHAEIRLESDDQAVRILTVHKAKGLEYPIVYCPYLWHASGHEPDGVLTHHDGDDTVLYLGLEHEERKRRIGLCKEEQLAEEIRVAYVALTRAKHRCSVVWGVFDDVKKAAAATLLHSDVHPDDVKKATDEQLHEWLTARLADAGEDASVRFVNYGDDAGRYQGLHDDVELEAARPLDAAPISSWLRTGSFSKLVEDAGRATDLDDDARDYGEEVAPQDDEHVDDSVGRAEAADPIERQVEAPSTDAITLLGFPKGKQTGNFFHAVFENVDFSASDPTNLERVVAEKMESFGVAADVAPDVVDSRRRLAVTAVSETLATPLTPHCDFRLADVSLGQRLNELEFHLPVLRSLGRGALADAFAQHPADAPVGAVPSDYAQRVRRLPFSALRGFLRGFIDLLFEHGGRYYVLDYKTNHLGDSLSDYGVADMTRAMAHSHYFLQYHLYSLATDRFLSRSVPGYRYDEHFGGVLYLFIKGMRPGSRSGVFFEKPPRARLDALSLAFGENDTWR